MAKLPDYNDEQQTPRFQRKNEGALPEGFAAVIAGPAREYILVCPTLGSLAKTFEEFTGQTLDQDKTAKVRLYKAPE